MGTLNPAGNKKYQSRDSYGAGTVTPASCRRKSPAVRGSPNITKKPVKSGLLMVQSLCEFGNGH